MTDSEEEFEKKNFWQNQCQNILVGAKNSAISPHLENFAPSKGNYAKFSERYSRQEILTEIKKEGQEKIRNSHVVIIGIGALGSVAAELLARAGVGRLTIVDRDVVELSNLQRQTIFTEKDVGKSKAVAAAQGLNKINSEVRIIPKAIHLTAHNCDFLSAADIILDCTDNLQTRFLINYYCHHQSKPWIYAAAIRTEGFIMPIIPGGPCLRCFISTTPTETCATAGVLNTITSSTASHQATLALKIIAQGIKAVAENELIKIDVWENTIRKIIISKRNNCPVCLGKNDPLLQDGQMRLVRFCSTGKYQILTKQDFKALETSWRKAGKVFDDGETLSFKNILLFRDGRALIKANSEDEAKVIYDQWIGN